MTAYGDAYGFVAELTFLANQYRETIVSQYENRPIIAEPGKDALSTYREWRNYVVEPPKRIA